MFYKTKTNKKGETRFEILERYKDPLTGKWKTASVSYKKDTTRARKQAERDLKDKIDDIIAKAEGTYNAKRIKTFGELKEDWLNAWIPTVKNQTAKREKFVLKRLGDIIGDDFLLEKITPLLIKNSLEKYIAKYNPSQSTIQHVKSSLNKVFDHGVLYGIITFSPVTRVKVSVSNERKKEVKANREQKFLEVHELVAFFSELSKGRNPNYYDLGIFLLFSGLRIGEAAAVSRDDINFETNTVTVDDSLQYHDLKVDEYYLDDTKTAGSEREVLLPKTAMDILKRVIKRGEIFDKYAEENPSKSFRKSSAIFRTEYGTPITSHTFRELISRIEDRLRKNCKKEYGFEWTKHVVPHSFRHMHITYLQSGDLEINLPEIMGRVGHVNNQTTMIYTHRTVKEQEKSVAVLDDFAESSGLNFNEQNRWVSKYSNKMDSLMQENLEKGELTLSVKDIREKLELRSNYKPREISSNIFPRLKRDMRQYYDGFEIETLKDEKQKVLGYKFTWDQDNSVCESVANRFIKTT